MNLTATFDEQPDGMAVHLRCGRDDGITLVAVLLPVGSQVNASKLVEAINHFADHPSPSAMHWVSSRLRNVPARERATALKAFDRYVEWSHD